MKFPGHILSYNIDEKQKFPTLNPQMHINRLQWIDETVLRIINYEGVEKLLDTSDNELREIKFN